MTPTQLKMTAHVNSWKLSLATACNPLDAIASLSRKPTPYSTHEDNIYYPASNHRTGFQAQWNAGMRAFMLDTHYLTTADQSASNVRFCHGDSDRGFSPCTYGAVDPWNWLNSLESEMNSEDRDVVTLLIGELYEPDHLKEIFDDVGLSEMMYIHEMNAEWPTLIDDKHEQETSRILGAID